MLKKAFASRIAGCNPRLGGHRSPGDGRCARDYISIVGSSTVYPFAHRGRRTVRQNHCL